MIRLAAALALAVLLAAPAMAGTGRWDNEEPEPGGQPVAPRPPRTDRPSRPSQPGQPARPARPAQPNASGQPGQPGQPNAARPAQPKGPAQPGPAAAAAGPGEEGSAPGVRIEKADDVVILTDGTKIVCTIVAVGQKRLLIIEAGAPGERAVERSEVESFHRGGGTGRTVGYNVERDTLNGVLVLKEQSDAAPGAGPAPAPKPGADPNPAPKPVADLGGLWKLLAGRPSAQALGEAFARNPEWGAAVSDLVRTKQLPPEARSAVQDLQLRLREDPEFTAGLADLVIKGKLPRGVLEILTQK